MIPLWVEVPKAASDPVIDPYSPTGMYEPEPGEPSEAGAPSGAPAAGGVPPPLAFEGAGVAPPPGAACSPSFEGAVEEEDWHACRTISAAPRSKGSAARREASAR